MRRLDARIPREPPRPARVEGGELSPVAPRIERTGELNRCVHQGNR